MKSQVRPLFILFAVLTLMTGVLYPLFVTGIAQIIFPVQANGSLIESNHQILGSKLIGQDFTGAKYFWGRPSATTPDAYNPFNQTTLTGSVGSNLGPLSKNLIELVQVRVNSLRAMDPENKALIPVDLVTASASGLDADISPAAAYFQASRIAKARGINVDVVNKLIDQSIIRPQFGLFGETRVNVLMLNLALEGIKLSDESAP